MGTLAPSVWDGWECTRHAEPVSELLFMCSLFCQMWDLEPLPLEPGSHSVLGLGPCLYHGISSRSYQRPHDKPGVGDANAPLGRPERRTPGKSKSSQEGRGHSVCAALGHRIETMLYCCVLQTISKIPEARPQPLINLHWIK